MIVLLQLKCKFKYFVCCGFLLLSFSQPLNAQTFEKIATLNPGDFVSYEALITNGPYLYAIKHYYPEGQLITYDISDPSSPIELSIQSYTEDEFHDLVITSSRLYLAGEQLTIFDITNPASPTFTAQLETFFDDFDRHFLDATETHLISCDQDELAIYDLTNPDEPFELKKIEEGFFELSIDTNSVPC